MKKTLFILFSVINLFFVEKVLSQNCIPTNLNGTTITYPCNATCKDLSFSIPDIRSDENYVISTVPYMNYPATSGTEVVSTYIDDKYSSLIPLTFPFCFYDSTYNNIIIGSNGMVTFEAICANQSNNYDLDPPITIPNNSVSVPSSITDRYIPRTAIMGAYMDIDPSITSGSPLRRIEYNVFGSAPCRKFVVSYYNVIFFGSSCSNSKMTSQIVLHEGTGIIEVYITEKPICTWNGGNAILGIQDYTRTKAVVAPGKNCTQWTETNTGYRFTPAGSSSRFISCEITDLSGTTLATATTSPGTPGMLNVDFPNFCPTSFGDFILKTTYNSCPTGTIVSTDTIKLTQSPQLTFTATTTDAACGMNNGSITVNVPTGSGVAPYTYILDGGTPQSTNVFTSVSGGSHTVTVTDINGCTNTITVVVNVIPTLTGTVTTTNTSCTGVNDGSITIVPTSGSGPYTFVLTPGNTTNTTGIFTGLNFGSYSITFTDANTCTGTVSATITAGSTITATATQTSTSCSGAADGTITVTPGSSGVGPFTYTLDGGTPQSSNVFTGVASGSHIILVKDSRGCSTNVNVTVGTGSSLTGAITQTPVSCPGNTDGTVTLTPITGVPPYTYNIDGGLFQTSNVFTGLSSGVHTVIFKDNNGCQGTRSITVGGGSGPSGSQTHTNTTCNGATDGTITVTPTVPGTYTYTLNPGAITQPGNTFTGLAAGTYSVTFTSAAGCSGTLTNIIISVGGSLSGTSSTTATSCSGASDGSITITPTIPGPHTYVLTGPGGPYTQTTPTFTGLAAGTYSVTFTNATGCSGSLNNLTVAAGSSLTGTQVHTNTTCQGATDGTITITPSIAGAYTYVLTGPGGPYTQTNGTFTSLAAGTYSATFTNASTCNGTINNIIIAAGPAITGTSASTATSCLGATDGTITITPSVAGTYTFILNPGAISQTNPVFTSLAAGNYSVSFSNSLGCMATVNNITVAAGSSLTASESHVNSSCQGASDGSISITPTVAGTYTYTLNPGAVTQTTGSFTGLTPGTYSVNFSNSFGCSGVINNIVIAAGPVITGTSALALPTCQGASDGTITISPAVAGTYTYQLTGPGGPYNQSNGNFTGLGAGTYSASFTNTLGCTGTIANIVLGAGPVATATSSSVATTCQGASDGSITLSPAIAGTYTYTLNPGSITQTNPLFTGLAAGTYNFSFTNTMGCSGTLNNVVIAAGPPLAANVVNTNTSCSGVNDGTITVTPTTAGTFTYILNPGAVTQTTGNFTSLAPGTYSVSVLNSLGCSYTQNNIVINAGAPLTGTSVTTATSCPTVNDGTITLSPTGTGPYTFTLNPGNIVQSSPTFTGLAAGTYSISFVSAAGCTGTIPVDPVVGMGSPIASTYTPVNPPCNGINDGQVTLLPSSGAAPFSFTLTDGTTPQTNSTGIFTALSPNILYSYSFTDAIGCTGTGSFTLTTNSALKMPNVNTMPLCNGDANGSIKLNGGGGVSPYQYAMGPGFASFQTTNTFAGLATGSYSFRIKDAVGCTKDTTITLLEPAQLTASATNSLASTCFGNDGKITVTGAGGTIPYQYSINGTAYQSNAVITAPAIGPYSNIKVKDAKGCIAAATPINVALNDTMRLTLGPDTTVCAGSSKTIYPQTNAATSIFTWTSLDAPANTIQDAQVKNAVVNPTDTARYALLATWGICQRRDTIQINVLRKPVAHAGFDTAVCYRTPATLHGSATNTSGPVTYTWTPSGGLSNPHAPVTQVTTTNDGTFIYTLTITDNYGCNFSHSDEVTVTVTPPVPAFAGNDTIAVLGQPHQLFGSGGVQYTWAPSAVLNNAFAQNPLAILQQDTRFTLTVKDIAGCEGWDTVFIKVYAGPTYYVPNAFSPNGDGRNDIFRPIPSGITSTEYFRVFNRFGELVFETNEWLKGWNGFYLGRKQPVGTYVWIIKGKDKNGKTVQQKGTVMLLQ
ncbi:MAG: hypothetical protein ABS68_04440 [Niastella sp. SCN 39-18]|nr:MAG: hypothetical protein ABS68_04440 [Niastella sp. SCN 39-18]OJW07559.1 MAG: hypothetical protein BGO53_03375 [Sphingobacteriales bacterium 39-19]